MKKLLLLLTLAFSLQPLAFGGTNAAVEFGTNSYQITVPPAANFWASNAVAIETALLNVGFGGSTNTNGNFFYPGQFFTNISGAVQIDSISPTLLAGLLPLTNLPGSLATLSSNHDDAMTNNAGQTIAQAIGATNTTTSNGLVTVITTTSNGLITVVASTSNSLLNSIAASTNTIAAASLTGIAPSNILNGVNGHGLTNIPDSALVGSSFLAATNPTIYGGGPIFGGGTFANTNTGWTWPTGGGITFQDWTGGVNPGGYGAGFFWQASTGFMSLDSQGNFVASGFIRSSTGIAATNITAAWGPLPYAVLPSQVVTNNMPVPVTLNLQSANLSGTNTLTGSWNIPSVTIGTLANGENGDIDIGTNTFVVLTGPTASFAVDGFVAKADGREFTAVNSTGQKITIRNLSGLDATAANRIITCQGGDLVLSTPLSAVKFHYLLASNAWMVTEINSLTPASVPDTFGELTVGGLLSVENQITFTGNGDSIDFANGSSLVEDNSGNLTIATTQGNLTISSATGFVTFAPGTALSGVVGLNSANLANGLTLNTNAFGYLTAYGTSGFTNGTLGGLALTTNHYYTNQFGARITVYLTMTNSAAAATSAIYIFPSSAIALPPFPIPTTGTVAIQNPVQFNLDPGGWFAITNTAGIYQVKTNIVQIW